MLLAIQLPPQAPLSNACITAWWTLSLVRLFVVYIKSGFLYICFFYLTDKVSFIPEFAQTSFLPANAWTVCLSFNFCSSPFEYKKIESIAAMTSKMFNSCRLHHSPETKNPSECLLRTLHACSKGETCLSQRHDT